MQDNYEAPVVGNVQVDIQVAQVVADFLLVMLQIPDSPLSRDQLEQFSAFREVVKAGPTKAKPAGKVLHDGIVIGDGPKCQLDRNTALRYLRGMIAGNLTEEQVKYMQVALVDAVAAKGSYKNPGINGKYCQGTFGYVTPDTARDFLSGRVSEISVTRGKVLDNVFPLYFAEPPNTFLRPDKAVWKGAKDHVKTKFTEEETKRRDYYGQ